MIGPADLGATFNNPSPEVAMSATLLPRNGLCLFRPPYRSCERITLRWRPEPPMPGGAVVWFMGPGPTAEEELAWVVERPRSLPLFIVLPPPEEILPLAGILRVVPELRPKGVLPGAGVGMLGALQTLHAAPPPSLPRAVTDYLDDEGVFDDDPARARVETILSRASHVTSIDTLARGLCQSRRTLGRFFHDRGLPVPSHWLQLGRLLHVAVQLQNTRTNINRVSSRFGFPDGFTMSNTMKRLTGYRPSYVRKHLGWEWIVAEWLRREGL